jgi:hypothetical protein
MSSQYAKSGPSKPPNRENAARSKAAAAQALIAEVLAEPVPRDEPRHVAARSVVEDDRPRRLRLCGERVEEPLEPTVKLITSAARTRRARRRGRSQSPRVRACCRASRPDRRGARARARVRARLRLWRSEMRRGGVLVHRSWLRVRPEERFTDKVFYEASFGTLSMRHAVPAFVRADAVLCTVPCLSAAAAAVLLARLAPRRPRVVLWI